MPFERITFSYEVGDMRTGAHCKNERDDRVATVDVSALESVRKVVAAFGDIGVFVPVEGFITRVLHVNARGVLVDGHGEGLLSGGGTGDITFGQRGGGGHGEVGGFRRVDGDGCIRLVVVPHVGDVAVVAIDSSGKFRAFALADDVIAADGQSADSRFEDGEVQRNDGVTAVGHLEGMRKIVAAFGDVGVIVPVECITLHGEGISRDNVVDGKMQGHNRVAAVDVSANEGVRKISACSDILVLVPVKCFASGGCGVARGGYVHSNSERLFACGGTGDIVDGQRSSGHNAVFVGFRRIESDIFAIFLRIPNVSHGAVVVCDRSGESSAFALTDSFVTFNNQRAYSRFEDGEMERHHTVSTIASSEGVRKVFTTFSDIDVFVPVE